jgi:DNA-directed RNA polymerase specialized sigma24 family protein
MFPRPQCAHTFHDATRLRLTTDPPEMYDVAPLIDIAAARRGQHYEFAAAVFVEHRAKLVRFVMKQFQLDLHTAEDVVQDAFVALIGNDIEPQKPLGFMFSVCRGLAVFIHRQSGNRMVKTRLFSNFNSPDSNHWGPRVASNARQPDDIAAEREMRRIVDDRLNNPRMRESVRHGLAMRIFEDVRHLPDNTTTEAERDAIYYQIELLKNKFADLRPTNKPPRLRLVKMDRHSRRAFDLWCVELNRPFENTIDAAAFVGLSPSSIAYTARFPNKTAGGYHWQWRPRPDGSRRGPTEAEQRRSEKFRELAKAQPWRKAAVV